MNVAAASTASWGWPDLQRAEREVAPAADGPKSERPEHGAILGDEEQTRMIGDHHLNVRLGCVRGFVVTL
ncbi:hypothetical protein NK8_63460 (plasmid) [Caballeronia sp. NK8]|uniref:hypothetical protein n=1 Tax=Caballeronia sp. NK8 TaxID=140098 RepID=UPI001BB5DEB7|nr:hypothetical protein [Caballeronia sp. NK8]BCQ28157.1 hypothetical protein NK8_63460 [Caballeronia sp. NK8]